MNRLRDKTALVTGAARGIGKAIAEAFVNEGAFVILSDINDKEGEQIANELGNRARYLHLNVENENEWQVIMSRETIDILINNAGILGIREELGQLDPENLLFSSWKKIHAVNLDGVFLGCKYFIRNFKARGGIIVNISSRSGIVGVPGSVAYASSKAGVRNLTKSVALYCANKKYKIRCNSVHPATIYTSMWGEGERREKLVNATAPKIPLGRFGMPDEVALGVIYLASDESSYLTGSELVIDGGILAGSVTSQISTINNNVY